MNNRDLHSQPPIVFLAGPPGSGKSTLGAQACKELGLKFLDLSMAGGCAPGIDTQRHALEAAIENRAAAVIALSWPLQQTKGIFKLARQSGEVLLLWAHPEDMQARSGYQEPLFTPSKKLKTRGGFGGRGTRCPEFRRLDQASDVTVLLVDMQVDEAVEELKAYISAIRKMVAEPPTVREGLSKWVKNWQEDHDADTQAAEIIVDAAARYLGHLRSEGASPRKISAVYSDLQAAGSLVFEYDAPKGEEAEKVLSCFSFPPWEYEFQRKFSDSESLVSRYRRTLQGFARYLRESGLLGKEEE